MTPLENGMPSHHRLPALPLECTALILRHPLLSKSSKEKPPRSRLLSTIRTKCLKPDHVQAPSRNVQVGLTHSGVDCQLGSSSRRRDTSMTDAESPSSSREKHGPSRMTRALLLPAPSKCGYLKSSASMISMPSRSFWVNSTHLSSGDTLMPKPAALFVRANTRSLRVSGLKKRIESTDGPSGFM